MFGKKKEKEKTEDTKKEQEQEVLPDWMSGPVVSTQAAVLLGTVLVFWLTESQTVSTLCIVVGIGDLLSLFAGHLLPGSLEGEQQVKEAKVEPQKEASTEQPAEKGGVTKEGSSVTEENVTVKKRVPMPSQQGVRKPETPPPEPVPEAATEEPVEIDIPTEPTPIVTQTDMSEEDLDNLFDF